MFPGRKKAETIAPAENEEEAMAERVDGLNTISRMPCPGGGPSKQVERIGDLNEKTVGLHCAGGGRYGSQCGYTGGCAGRELVFQRGFGTNGG